MKRALGIFLLLITLTSCGNQVAVRRQEHSLSQKLKTLDGYVFKALNESKEAAVSESLPRGMVIYKYHGDSLVFWAGEFRIFHDGIGGSDSYSRINTHRSSLAALDEDYSYADLGGLQYIAYKSAFPDDITIVAALDVTRNESLEPLESNLQDPIIHIPSRIEAKGEVAIARLRPNAANHGDSRFIRELFSSRIYAGRFLHNPFEFILTNLLIAIALLLCARISKGKILSGVLLVALLAWIHILLLSLIHNSQNLLSAPTVTAFLMLLSFIPFPYLVYTFLSRLVNISKSRLVLALAFVGAVYGTALTETTLPKKEKARAQVWAELLSKDRDLRFEIMLQNLEIDILSDTTISSLMVGGDLTSTIRIQDILKNNHLYRIPSNFDVSYYLTSYGAKADEVIKEFILARGSYTSISRHGCIYYIPSSGGYMHYAALFSFYSPVSKVYSHILLRFDENEISENTGLKSLLATEDGSSLPDFYSYARYSGGKLSSHKGLFAYPVLYSPSISSNAVNGGRFTHYIFNTAPDEIVIISRPAREFFSRALVFIHIFLIILITISILTFKRKEHDFRTRKFSTRIYSLVIISLLLVLITMAVVSVVFVFRSSGATQAKIMSDKITTAQTLFKNRILDASLKDVVQDDAFVAYFNAVSRDTKSDYSLYSPEGKVYLTTQPFVYERRITSTRISSKAYQHIVKNREGYYIEKISGDVSFLYAPITNSSGELTAILLSPFSTAAYSFTRDAFNHAAMVLGMFFLLLSLVVLLSGQIIRSLFKPLIRMGEEMSSGNYNIISYDREDEVSVIVNSYNQMVHEIARSQKLLAQSERDKAWSEMARQVAHEIKNPLTPIKLEIQRLIRLKQRGVEDWDIRFEKACKVVLEHIDILADTANEFSTFAKLYTQENTVFDINAAIEEQVGLFSGREGIEIQYLGMEGCKINGPKPQLIRVLVNERDPWCSGHCCRRQR